ncbi:MAG: type II toxin-antitoxin system PemK/MazF family toxin [Candidatus Aminicenantes bacterium]|nr:type II toxin-antitoxin system PemK/MazF family toxin [Candidatus Aminicenantes bacterium]NIM78880.1 type II toxin-antitoxin system PemK/MazF family toxin [Candidatus Aminicenantes bacterium]NIN18136.1 type II toxin-antitoxin system PemK/MazF family toxin [Candidatus Aminicenantes bacterium]NIN42035.1 type II toxin-antitoxin system PemK/MazF family toxin [Candidatus Aminicenantes bacterium]NIN84791.1 type II toxin-antitoxin system PemK/MazF family toxin [Candidatus Aminicenantes bacterium]
MTSYKCGDIVLTKVIFSEGEGVKKRPALVVSSDRYHKNRQEIIIAAITSNIYRSLTGDTRINQWEEAGLRFPSVVTGIFQTIKKDMIDKKLGTLGEEDFRKVKGNLKQALGIY